MEKDTEADALERHFGHSFITWQIRNFCFDTSREEFLILSPEFCVDGLHSTKWKMSLNPKMKQSDEYHFFLSFERTESDTAPLNVCVDLKFWLMNCEGKECGIVTYKGKFKKSNPHMIPLWSESFARDVFKPSACKSGIMTIWCHIVVDFEDSYNGSDGPSDMGIKKLSEDFVNLYKVGTNHDVILRFNTSDIYAHKAILYSRSTTLTNIIENKVKDTVVDLSHLDYETMKNIVAYFYSGNIDYIAKKPSILTYEYALCLQLPDIKQYYNPHSLEIQSLIDVREHTFSWTVTNTGQSSGDCIESPLFTTDYMDTAWRISIYDMNHADKHLGIFADVVKGTIPKYGCLEFAIVDDDEELWSKKMKLSGETHERLGFNKFIPRKSLEYILKNVTADNLNIALKIELHNEAVTSQQKYSITVSAVPVDKYYQCFSLNILFLFENSVFTDVTLEAEGISFKAHKCVLSARSRVFDFMLKETNNDKLAVLNTKSHILYVVLNYIYSGVYEKFKLEDIFEVYRAAEHFSLSILKRRCSNILKDNFVVQSICDAVVFSCEQNDMDLKLSALNFICRNKNTVFEDDNWKSFKVKNQALSTEVINFINSERDLEEISPQTI